MATMQLEKITKTFPGAGGRRYVDACGAAHALDLVGERWALLVVRELMFGPRRFGELRSSLHGISANVLTQRLEGLEAAGVVARRKLPPPASVQVYDLTDWGREIRPVFAMLGIWAARSPSHDPTLPLSPISLMMSFQTMFRSERAPGVRLTVGFAFGDEAFTVTVANGDLDVVRGVPDRADVTLAGVPSAVAGVVYGGAPVEDMEAAGALGIAGDRAVFARFVGLFELPPKVGADA